MVLLHTESACEKLNAVIETLEFVYDNAWSSQWNVLKQGLYPSNLPNAVRLFQQARYILQKGFPWSTLAWRALPLRGSSLSLSCMSGIGHSLLLLIPLQLLVSDVLLCQLVASYACTIITLASATSSFIKFLRNGKLVCMPGWRCWWMDTVPCTFSKTQPWRQLHCSWKVYLSIAL